MKTHPKRPKPLRVHTTHQTIAQMTKTHTTPVVSAITQLTGTNGELPVKLVDSGFTCGQWFHLECQDIGSGSYDLGRSDVTWHCIICANANYPTVTFDLRGIDTSQHSLTSDSSLSVNMDCSFHPLHTSTPTKASKWTNTHNDHSVSRL